MARHPIAPRALACALACAWLPWSLPAVATDPAPACRALARPLAQGAFLTSELAIAVPCRAERPELPLRFDRAAAAPEAVEALPAGTYLGRIALHPGPIAAAGEPLQLVIRSGPVIIAREVSPLRPLRSGERGLVRAADGTVLMAPFVAGAGQ